MKSEETIINQSGIYGNAEAVTETNRKQGKGKRIATTAGAAVAGGAAGAGGMYAATNLLNDSEEEEQKKQEAQTAETPKESAEEVSKPKQKTHHREERETAAQKEAEDNNHYEDASTTSHQTGNTPDNTSTSDDLHVLGVTQIQGHDGQPMKAALLSHGDEVAAVVDTDMDGKADYLVVDEDHNRNFEQDEVHDVSSENWRMSDYEHLYAQQNGQPNPDRHEPQTYDAGNNASDASNEVKVLGVYQTESESGQTMESALLSNGQETAVVVDVDGDGYANVLAVDENLNQQIDEGEVYDISSHQVPMSVYEQDYLAQQQQEHIQEQMQQEQDSYSYNAADEQTDYNDDMNVTSL